MRVWWQFHRGGMYCVYAAILMLCLTALYNIQASMRVSKKNPSNGVDGIKVTHVPGMLFLSISRFTVDGNFWGEMIKAKNVVLTPRSIRSSPQKKRNPVRISFGNQPGYFNLDITAVSSRPLLFSTPVSLAVILSLGQSPRQHFRWKSSRVERGFSQAYAHSLFSSSNSGPSLDNRDSQTELWSCNKMTDQLLGQPKLDLLSNDLPTSMEGILLISCSVWGNDPDEKIWDNSTTKC